MIDSAMSDRWLTLGRIVGVFGVKGWVKVESFTEPRANIFSYVDWLLVAGSESVMKLDQGKVQGQGLVAKLHGVEDRDQAVALVGAEIRVQRNQLPPTRVGEYYWVDLEGLDAFTVDGARLGQVSHLFATGANDVLVIQGERQHLVPYVPDQYVMEVDLVAKRIVVDWDPTF